MKKLSTIQQLGWLSRSMLGGSIAVTSASYALDIIGFNFSPGFLTASPIIGISVTSFWWYLYQLDLLVYRPCKTNSFAYSVNRIAPMDNPDIQTTMLDIPLNEPLEFVFSHSELLIDVSLSRLTRFIGAGMRRQQRATAIYKGGKRFLITQAWSMNYFTVERMGRARFRKEEVISCQKILAATGKWDKSKRQGHPGSMPQVQIFQSPGSLADDVMTLWKRKTGYKTPVSHGWVNRTKRRLKRWY